jgi:hypothetical protein
MARTQHGAARSTRSFDALRASREPRRFVCALLACASIALASSFTRASSDSLVPSSALGADKIAFDPKTPSKASKQFTVEHHLALQSLKLEDNGVEQLAQQELNFDTKQTLRTLDEYKACAGGRPTILRRNYEEASLHVDVTSRQGNGSDAIGRDAIDAKSPFEGMQVQFTWVPEEKGYGKLYTAKEGDEGFLPFLTEDLDVRAVLPDHAVSVGDEWTIDPALLVDWVAPGGYLPMQFQRKKDDRFVRTLNLGVGGGLTMVFGGDVKGKVTARYEGKETQGDASLAVIALTVDVATERDQTQAAQNMLSADELLEGNRVRRSAVQWKMVAEGKARWNTALNRFESLEIAGREDVSYELTLGLAHGGKSVQTMVLSGGIRVAGSASSTTTKPK